MFQFHNGTINTLHIRIDEPSFLMFQFHNGTINTSCTSHMKIYGTGFNSTMVQLIRSRMGLYLMT